MKVSCSPYSQLNGKVKNVPNHQPDIHLDMLGYPDFIQIYIHIQIYPIMSSPKSRKVNMHQENPANPFKTMKAMLSDRFS